MSPPSRRKFVKRAGMLAGAVAVGGSATTDRPTSWRAATGVAAAEEDLPPLRGPYADEDWVEFRSGPGNTRAIDTAPQVDSTGPECQRLYDGEVMGDPVVVEDTMYIADADGIRALDVRDGSVEWTRDVEGEMEWAISAAYHTLLVRTRDASDPHDNDSVVRAYDIQDGSPIWTRRFDSDTTSHLSIAYESVYLNVGGVTHALDVADGSSKWETAIGYLGWVAVSEGRVFTPDATDEHDGSQLVALDAFDGEELWRVEEEHRTRVAATDGRVVANNNHEVKTVYDAASGEPILTAESYGDPALDDEALVTTDRTTLRATFFDDRDDWTVGPFESTATSDPTIAGEEVYVYFGDAGTEYDQSLVSFDKYTGEVNWACEMPSIEGPWPDIVATRDGVYVTDGAEIQVVRSEIADEPTQTEEEPTPTEREPTPTEDDQTPTDTEPTPTDTEPTPTDGGPTPTDDGRCPTETDGSGACPPDDRTPTGSPTVSDTVGSTPTDSDSAVVAGSPTETDGVAGDGPGLGIVSTITAVGGLGYLVRRRLGERESDASETES